MAAYRSLPFWPCFLDNIDFNLDPNKMQNKGKYFVMITNGCFVGNIFNTYYSLSEQFLLLKDKAAVGYVGLIILDLQIH